MVKSTTNQLFQMSQIHILIDFSQNYLLLENNAEQIVSKNVQQFSQFLNYFIYIFLR